MLVSEEWTRSIQVLALIIFQFNGRVFMLTGLKLDKTKTHLIQWIIVRGILVYLALYLLFQLEENVKNKPKRARARVYPCYEKWIAFKSLINIKTHASIKFQLSPYIICVNNILRNLGLYTDKQLSLRNTSFHSDLRYDF